MKRRLYKLALFLVLGAVVTVGVAWGCALAPRREVGSLFTSHPQDLDRAGWLSHSGAKLPSNFHWDISETADVGYRVIVYHPTPSTSVGHMGWPSVFARVVDAGLPFLALRGKSVNAEYVFHDGRCHTIFTGRNYWAIQEGTSLSESNDEPPRYLPLFPIWRGFAINTIFYAAILWLLAFGPVTVRRFVRDKRGRCIKCGYDLRGAEHEVCPECGQELRARAKV